MFQGDENYLFLKSKLEIDQHCHQHKHDSIANDDWPKHERKRINQPHYCTAKDNKQHSKTQVTNTFCLPRFIYLRDKGDAT